VADPKLVEIIDHKEGTFKINDWSAYPDEYVPMPDKNKVWTLLEADEYELARKQANDVNRNLRKGDRYYSDNRLEIHEVEPVKFGCSPIDVANKTAIQGQAHRKYVTPWWNKIRDEVKKGLDK
jgi:filamentous hemagglutinin